MVLQLAFDISEHSHHSKEMTCNLPYCHLGLCGLHSEWESAHGSLKDINLGRKTEGERHPVVVQ